jgi:hypothetical protein
MFPKSLIDVGVVREGVAELEGGGEIWADSPG